MPATYIIGTDGKIKYVHFNLDYKIRASVDEIVEPEETIMRRNWFLVLFLFFLFPFMVKGEDKMCPLSAEEVCPILVGMKIPTVIVKTMDGNEVSLYDVISKKPTVLIFYRGGWCPYCNLQLGQLQEIETQLMNMGYQIVAISADRYEKLKESIQKKNIKYTLLSDSTMKAAQSFRIAFHVDDSTVKKYKEYGLNIEEASGEKHHILPVTSVFVLKTNGTIIFSYVNPDYKVRISPEVLIAVAKAALKN